MHSWFSMICGLACLIGARPTGATSLPEMLSEEILFGNFAVGREQSLKDLEANCSPPTVAGTMADVVITTIAIPGAPEFDLAEDVTAHVRPNGEIFVNQRADIVGPAIIERSNINLTYSGIELGIFGLRADGLTVYLPAGFGVGAAGNLDKTVIDYAELTNVTLGTGMIPTANVTLGRQAFTGTAGGAPLYPMVDRVPVRFETGAIIWTPANGQFSFTQNSGVDLIYYDQFAIQFLDLFEGFFLDVFPIASNELYYLSAKDVLSTIRVGAHPNGGAKLVEAEFTLDPGKFSPPLGSPYVNYLLHYPKMFTRWTQAAGSKIRFANGEVDTSASVLKGATGHSNGFFPDLAYAKGLQPVDPGGDCPETTAVPFGAYRFVPNNQEWRFTRDGGLRAEGDIFRPGSPANKLKVEWGYYDDDGTDRYAHRITETFAKVRVSTAGVAAPGDVTDLLYSGHSAPGNDTLLERPGSPGYEAGLADYPGVNVRVGANTIHAVSQLAGEITPSYQLDPSSKYVLRSSGVTGRHVSVPNTSIQLTAYGGIDFNLSGIALAYCNGSNYGSGINGGMDVPLPANFTLNFERLRFGDQGQFLGAAIAPGQGEKTLGVTHAWDMKFKPLALDFPQPDTCPSPKAGEGYVRITAESTLTALSPDPLTGTIGIKNGDIVSATDVIALNDAGKEPQPVSSFKPNGNLYVTGPDLTPGGARWTVNPVTDIMINKWAETHPGEPTGTLTVGGLMDVPFFEDMPVVLSANSATGVSSPAENVRLPYPLPTSLNTVPFDPDHRGRKSGNSLAHYRSDSSNHPIAERAWQDVVDFSFPLKLGASGVFASPEPESGDLFLFHLREEVTSMTPSGLEMTFDGKVDGNLLPQVNAAGLLAGAATSPVRMLLQDAFDGLGELDGLLTNDLSDLLGSGLTNSAFAAIDVGEISALADPATRVATLVGFGNDLDSQLANLLGEGGVWRADLRGQVTRARTDIATLQGVLDTIGGTAGLAKLLASGAAIGELPTHRIDELEALLGAIDAGLEDVQKALTGPGKLTASLNAAFDTGQRAEIIAAALFDVSAKWAPPNPNTAAALYASAPDATLRAQLVGDLARALATRTAGSDFSGDAMRLLRLYVADTHTLAKQAVDDTLRTAEQMIANAADPLDDAVATVRGDLKQYLGSADLRGYARINGDSLNELRLDGHITLKVPDDMEFDGWFLLRDVDSDTPTGACLEANGIKTEIAMGASGKMTWGDPTSPIDMKLGGKVGIDGSGDAVSICGDLGIGGEFDLSAVTIRELQLGFGFGGPEGYLYGRAAGKIAKMDVEAGIFAGQTCNLEIIKNADKDIGDVIVSRNLTLPDSATGTPIIGVAVYAEGGMSLMPLIGVPPSCFLDLRLHGGQGFFGFRNGGSDIVGIKTLQGVSGELLCIVDVSGKFATVYSITGNDLLGGGSPKLNNFSADARATLRGELDLGLFSVGFERSKKMTISATPVTWRFK